MSRHGLTAFLVIRNQDSGKDSMGQVFELSKVYQTSSAGERCEIDEYLCSLLESDSELDRYDACFLARERRIVALVPALRRLQERLETADVVSAPFEWATVNRLVRSLASEK